MHQDRILVTLRAENVLRNQIKVLLFPRYKKGRQSSKQKRMRRLAFKRLALQQQFVSLSIPRPLSIPAMVKEKINIESM